MRRLFSRGRIDRTEAGASLVIAMAMVTFISVALVAALGFAGASLRSVTVIGTQRANEYAADSAMQTAIQTLRTSATSGTTANGTACPALSYSVVAGQPAASVACQVVAGHTPGVLGVSMPQYEILALGNSTAEQGIVAYPTLDVNSPIASNSPATGAGGIDSIYTTSSIDATGTTVDAKGDCPGTITVSKPADKRCSTGLTYADPGYPSQTLPALTAPNPSPTCTVTNGVLQFAPGYYTNTALFETPTWLQGGNTCKTGYLYFAPGVYYFDFGFDPAYTDPVWNVPAGQVIVGGEYKGWNPNTANSFPGVPGGGTAVGCKTEADGATSGVQFVFGGTSQMTVATSAAKVELCADPTPTGTSQQLAIVGQKTGAASTAQTATRVPTAATPTPSTGWTNIPAYVLPVGAATSTIDAKAATYTMPSGATDNLALTGYLGASAVVPAGSINVSYALKVAHAETVSSAATNVSSLTATIGACAVSPTTHSATGSTVSLTTDTIPLTTTACIAAVQSNFTLTYKAVAASGKTFVENLDGVDLVITYTPPGIHAESGCLILINGAGGCSLLNFGSNGDKVVVWGTVYAPLASVLNDDNNSSVVELRRGIVARAVGLENAPSDSSGAFCLGGGSPCQNQTRVMMLTVTVAGNPVLRALIQVADAPTLGAALTVISWNVLR